MDVEDTFDIQIEDDVFDNIETIQDVVDAVKVELG